MMTMSDREILELAAKAAGYEYRPQNRAIVRDGIPSNWNPLTDDGDALRLAVKLQLQITPGTYNKEVVTAYSPLHYEANERPRYGQDELASTRRAIVLVAAQIGKQMQDA